jgi:tRNA(Ile)-lysidine synthetase-like protein
MLNSIIAEVNRRAWNLNRQRVLLALSGGRDSVALFYAFMELGYEFEVAHINYGLRGSESDGDEDFVKKICINHHIICHVHQANPETSAPGESTQMWARRVRYDFFGGILSSRNLDYTVVAHHAGDQLEHFFIYLWRNQIDTAFRGMLPQNGAVIRPMLGVLPSQIKAFLEQERHAWREDSSNAKTDYLRNKIRHGIIGLMPDAEEQMHAFLKVSEAFQVQWQEQVSVWSSRWQWKELDRGYWVFQGADLKGLELAWKQAFQQLGFSRDTWQHCQEDTVRVGARFVSGLGYVLVSSRGGLWYLFKEVKDVLDWKGILGDGELGFDFGEYRFRWCRGQDWKGEGMVLGRLPQENTGKLLRVRGFQMGDRMPLKGGGTQKLSDLVTNEKWNPYEKSRMMVAEAAGAVVMAAAVGREVAGWEAADWVLVGLVDVEAL